ncbi:MAG TPA: hypothetical protein PLS60_11150, partial [Arenimonas sp.]|nr:hypothetical protein [Arenimonas sp.]
MMDRDFIRRLKGYEILTDEGREIVEQIITSPPARSVGRYSITSISGEFPSEKLGESVQYESKGCEKCFVHLSEIDSGTTCIFSQPWEIIVLATDCRGRKGPRPKTFDFLEITPSLFSFVEAKPVEKIRIEQKKSPVDWVELEPNCWKYLPGELKAKSYGMGCKVFCPQFYSKAFLSNLAFRVCITQDALSEQELGRVEILKKHLIKRPHTVNSLCELIGNVRASLIFRAISQGLLFGLPELQLFEPDFLVYGTEAEADRTRSELYQYALPTTELLGPMARRLERASATERLAARSGLKRYKAAREAEHKKKKWDYAVDKRLKAVAAEGAPELAAYIPDFQGRGSHESKIDSETLESIKKDIRTHWPQLHKPCIA